MDAHAPGPRGRRAAPHRGGAVTLAYASHIAGLVHELRGDSQALLACAEREFDIASAHSFAFWIAGGMCLRGRALAARGAAGDGLELMTGGAAICRATGAGLAIAYYSSYIGEAHLVANNVPEGLAAVTEGLAAAEHEEHFYTADLYRFRGTLLAASHAASEEVEAAFRSAIGIASRQGSRVLALRAATAFAEYLRARGRDAEAQQMLDGLEDTFSHQAGSASA